MIPTLASTTEVMPCAISRDLRAFRRHIGDLLEHQRTLLRHDPGRSGAEYEDPAARGKSFRDAGDLPPGLVQAGGNTIGDSQHFLAQRHGFLHALGLE